MEKKCRIFVVKRLHLKNFFGLHLDLDFTFKTILDCGWTWTEFIKIRTGSGWQNMTVRSSLLYIKKILGLWLDLD